MCNASVKRITVAQRDVLLTQLPHLNPNANAARSPEAESGASRRRAPEGPRASAWPGECATFRICTARTH